MSGRSAAPAGGIAGLDPARIFSALDLSSRRKIIVAVSGGGDSLALLILLKRHLETTGSGTQAVAVTVDHRLRPESAAEARQVEAIARGIGVEHRTVTWEGVKPGTGISAAAREARHRLLAQAAHEAGADIVLTGHTMDDQAETVAMRARRGEGRGAAGIASATLFEGRVWFARPLLGVRRAALRDYLTGIGQGWIDDPSNDDRRYERVRARAALSDAEVNALAAQAIEAGREREVLGVRAAAMIAGYVSVPEPGVVRLAGAFPAAGARDAGVYALRILLASVGGVEQLPGEARTAALFDRLADEPLRATFSRCLIERRRGDITIRRERRGKATAAPHPPTLGPWARYLPSFDLAPARALAALLGATEIAPPPFPQHNRPKA